MKRSSARDRVLLLLPGVVFVALFARSLDYAFVWTDGGEIVSGGMILPPGRIAEAFSKPMLGNLAAGGQPYYRPVQVVVASAIDALAGREPHAFRGVALALGALNAVLFSGFAYALSRRRNLALASGLLYATHPVLVESHVWIAALSQSLSTAFLLASLWTGCAAIRRLEAGGRARGVALALLSAALLEGGLLSKESVVVGPALMGAVWLAAAGREGARHWRAAAGVVALQVLAVAATFGALRPAVLGETLAGFPPIGGNLRVHVLTAIASWPGSIGWLLWPVQSSTSDVVGIAVSPLDLRVLLSVALVTVSAIACARLWWRGHGVAALGLAWVWIAFAPTSGLVPLTHMRALRYVYLSSFGVALAAPPLLALALRRVAEADHRRDLVVLCTCVLLSLGLGVRTWQRTPDWRSNLALFGADVASDPLYLEGYHMLASAQAADGRPREAKQTLDTLLDDVLPRFTARHGYLHEANMLTLYCDLSHYVGRPGDNLRFEARMTPDAPALPRFPLLYYQCGARTFEAVGDLERALGMLRALLEAAPQNEALWRIAKTRCLAKLGRIDAARAELARVDSDEVRDAAVYEQLREARALLGSAAQAGDAAGAGAQDRVAPNR